MTCLSLTEMAMFLSLITVPVELTDTGLVIHAKENSVTYVQRGSQLCAGGEPV